METSLNRDLSAASTGIAEASRSAVNWAAALAGAVVALATTLILITLGSGLGFAVASPWPGAGATGTTFAIGVGIWLIVTQWLSSLLGGYLAGRLRTKWTGIHSHEVVFRDTAHGLLAWAVATAIIGVVALGATVSTAGAVVNAAAASVSAATDTMLRSTGPNGDASDTVRAEVTRLLASGKDLQSADKSYLTEVIATRTGVSRQDAQQRVDAAVTSIRQAADEARKVSVALSLFTALSMLIGAFIASAAAAYGGQLRDKHADLIERT